MSQTTDAGVQITSDPTYTPAELAAARQAGADAERTRIFAVLDHPEAATRREAAMVLARNPAMDAGTAGQVLSALPAPAAAAPAPTNALALQMAAMGNPPTLGTDPPEQDPGEDIQASWARVRGQAA